MRGNSFKPVVVFLRLLSHFRAYASDTRKTPSGFRLFNKKNRLTELCEIFWGQPETIEAVEKWRHIKFDYNKNMTALFLQTVWPFA